MQDQPVRVWDPLVRVVHWLLVAGFVIGYVTEGEPLAVHIWSGYTVATLVVVRVIWGFIGTSHARFSDFVYRPGKVFGYLGALPRGRSPRYIGHSPAGGAMTVALLCFLAAICLTGMMTLADTYNGGPLQAWLGSPEAAARAAAAAAGERVRYDSPYEDPHELLVNFTFLLVIFHVAGVVLASFVHKENLTRAMITGIKNAN